MSFFFFFFEKLLQALSPGPERGSQSRVLGRLFLMLFCVFSFSASKKKSWRDLGGGWMVDDGSE